MSHLNGFLETSSIGLQIQMMTLYVYVDKRVSVCQISVILTLTHLPSSMSIPHELIEPPLEYIVGIVAAERAFCGRTNCGCGWVCMRGCARTLRASTRFRVLLLLLPNQNSSSLLSQNYPMWPSSEMICSRSICAARTTRSSS